MGWGLEAILTKMAKTRCVSDLRLSTIVRHAASFGDFDKKSAKTRCVSDNLSRRRHRPLFRWPTGDEFWGVDPGKTDPWDSPDGSGIRHVASFGTKPGILFWYSLRVWLRTGPGVGLGRFYPDPSSNSGYRPKRVDLILG